MSFDPRQLYEAYKRDPNHDMNEYLDLLVEESRGRILEIGVRWGTSTACFLLGKAERVISVDINPACEGHFSAEKRWTFLLANSRTNARVVNAIAGAVDVLFIDGDHSYEGLTSDLDNFHDLVRPGGTILVHDVNPRPEFMPTPKQISEGWAGEYTRRAWLDFLARHPEYTRVEELPGKFGMGVIRV